MTCGLDRTGVEPVQDDGWHIEDLGTQQHEQPADMGRRQA